MATNVTTPSVGLRTDMPEAPGARPPEAPAARQETGFLAEMGDLTVFALRTLRELPGSARYMSETLRHAAEMIRGTWLLMFVMNFFLGMTIVTFGSFFLRGLGAGDFVGMFTGYIVPREIVPGMFAYVVSAKICCGIAATAGAMKIQQEVDALESVGIDPMQYVVGTRVLAMLLFVPVGTAFALAGATIGAYVDATIVLQVVDSQQMMTVHWSANSIRDQVFALVTCTMVALPAVIVACFYGLRTTGGPAAVGAFAARSMLVNLTMVHVVTAVAAVAYYGTSLQIPIGG